MSTFQTQVAQAERRFAEAAQRRAGNKAFLDSGRPFLADTPERVRLWFRRRGLSPDLAERAIKAGSVPLEAQEAFRPVGKQEPLGLERVLGTTDFLGIAFLERGLQVARTVGRVAIRGRTGSASGYGTGFMVGPRLLMTNNHVLGDAAEAADSVVEFDYYTRSDGAPATVTVFSLQPEVFFLTDPDLDFTLVAVAEAGTRGVPLASFGWNQLIPDEGKAIIGQWVNVIQHPNGEPKQLVLRNNEIVDTPEQFLTYVADTSPGSSGSPVFNDQWEVVALHHAGVPKRDADGNVLNLQDKPWQPWMGEQNVKWISNEGARVSRIVAHVNAQALSSAQRALFNMGLQRPPSPVEAQAVHASPQSGAAAPVQAWGQPPEMAPDGTAVWTIPLRISMSLGGFAPAAAPAVAGPSPQADGGGTPRPPTVAAVATQPSDERSILEAARAEFLKRPEVLDVRLGRRFENGWVTKERAIVVTVDEKKTQFDLQRAGRAALPQTFAGYPVQLSGPTLRQLVGKSLGGTAFTESLRTEEILYVPPATPLQTVEEKMKLQLHLSPDAGWPSLQAFLSGAKQKLVIGMYDFGAPHILDEILAKPQLKEVVLVMQRGESLGTGTKKDDLPDAEVAQKLSDLFGDRFQFGWVKMGLKNGWVAYSYHIKVAVRDSKAFWLSSGNWQSSNQPPVDLAGSGDYSYLEKYNREWHAIVQHEGLAKTYEAFLRHDLKKGTTRDFNEALAVLPNIAIPALEARRKPRPNPRYFAPLELDETIRVTPLLTPDNYFDALIRMVKSARREILLQNQTFNAPGENQEKLAELLGLLQEKQQRMPVRIIFRLLMPSDARRNLEALIDMGFDPDSIRVQPNLHTKGLIVDGKKVLLGSQNISETGISLNRDASLLFEHEGIADYFREIFEHDWENLAQKDIGGSFKAAWATNEATAEEGSGVVLLSPKDYLEML